MITQRLASSLPPALAILAVCACGGARHRAIPETSQPELTSRGIEPAGPNIGVSAEIARMCKLHMGDVASAPKYEFDRSDLQPGDRSTLVKIAECLTTGPLKGRSVQLIGRADTRGESNYNMALGAQRAGGVADYLAHLGVARGHLAVTSRGELDAVGTDERGWQTDRRVDIVLSR
ncbi:MAG TPA: OmpA family protein [Gaiellaceae bacterium]|nr:OmpA family protein [Gaiellaceae bacterium]